MGRRGTPQKSMTPATLARPTLDSSRLTSAWQDRLVTSSRRISASSSASLVGSRPPCGMTFRLFPAARTWAETACARPDSPGRRGATRAFKGRRQGFKGRRRWVWDRLGGVVSYNTAADANSAGPVGAPRETDMARHAGLSPRQSALGDSALWPGLFPSLFFLVVLRPVGARS